MNILFSGEVEKRLKPTTMRYYRHRLAGRYILPELARGRSKAPVTAENVEALREKGRGLPLHKITTEQIDRLRRSLLERGGQGDGRDVRALRAGAAPAAGSRATRPPTPSA